jgi:hypothetical protein
VAEELLRRDQLPRHHRRPKRSGFGALNGNMKLGVTDNRDQPPSRLFED